MKEGWGKRGEDEREFTPLRSWPGSDSEGDGGSASWLLQVRQVLPGQISENLHVGNKN